MSTMHKVHTIKLNQYRPVSHAFLMRMLAVSLAAGHKAIDVKCCRQFMQLDFHDNTKEWRGMGAINQETGHHIARELNTIRQFVLDHFEVIHIRHARA